jgi:hypothetical protein
MHEFDDDDHNNNNNNNNEDGNNHSFGGLNERQEATDKVLTIDCVVETDYLFSDQYEPLLCLTICLWKSFVVWRP